MMRDYAEEAPFRRNEAPFADRARGRINRRLVEAFLKIVPEVACEVLNQRVFRVKEGLMPSSLP